MELLLVAVSLVALVLAAVMSVVAWKLLRHGRLRSSARVEALESMALAEAPAEEPRLATAMLSESGPVDDPWDLRYREAAPVYRESARHERHQPAADLSYAPDVTFGAAIVRQPPSRRWLALAVVGTVVLLGVGTVYALRSAPPITEFVRDIVRSRPNLAAAEPLELLSLRHAADPSGTFTVTGLVQNPAEGISLEDIVAVVYLFDENGQYFASGRAQLDLPAFRPGDESPFVVSITNAASVRRYRVGFRLSDGGVVGHIDRRGQLPHNTTGDALDGIGRAFATPASGPRRSEG